ncbi:MAG: acetate kinase [Acidobacteriota bacterium]|jgi:acetate kinase|nr:acetate kinase [Acidobacteriota bacterium]
MNVLVLNCGSSSLKFQLIATDLETIEREADRELARGAVERIGSEAILSLRVQGKTPEKLAMPLRDHREALDYVLRWLVAPSTAVISSLADVHAVGHRVVHGGEKLTRSVVIDEAVIEQIEDCIDLAPLHNPANLKGIFAAHEVFGPGIPQAAVFDTSFHSTMPAESFLYAIPYQLYVRHRVRRYGFHGTSHRYIAYRYRQLAKKEDKDTNILTLHLGNGCSICAIRGGESLETSMGLTPAEGLVMGTRSGDLDPLILDFLHHKEGMSFDELDNLVNKRSGLLGISGLTNDMRDLLAEERENQDRRARLAIDIFCLRVKKYIGAYLARMNGADAIVFAGGIGENSPEIRRRICADLDFLGIALDPARNEALTEGKEGEIGADGARVRTYVIPTNEELLIARDTVRSILDAPRRW